MGTTQQPTANTKTNIRFLKPAQVEQMRDAAYEGHHGQRDDAIVTLLYDTGLRRGELSAVDLGMLDLDDGQLRLPGHVQKDYPNDNSPSPVTIEIDPEGDLRTVRTVRSYLSTRDDDSPALFPSQKSDRMGGKGINDVVTRLAHRADVQPHTHTGRGETDDVTAHTLRHSVAYRMLYTYDGYTLYNVSQRLRHSRLSTTEEKYVHLDTV